MYSVHNQPEPRESFDFLSTPPHLFFCQVGLITCKTVCIGKRTRLGHLTSAGISDVQSIFGSEDGVEESVTSVNGAVNICEVNDKPERVRRVWKQSKRVASHTRACFVLHSAQFLPATWHQTPWEAAPTPGRHAQAVEKLRLQWMQHVPKEWDVSTVRKREL